MISKAKTGSEWISAIFVIVMLAYTLLHIGLWSEEPPDVDPVNFVMALDYNDISTDRPHPPGYPLYVGLAKVASHLVGNAHAYQFINLSMLLLACTCLFKLTKNYGYPEVGFATVVLLITHPLTFSATLVQESYFSDAFFGCLIVTWVLIKSDSFKSQLIGIFIIFFALGLFRIVSCAELGLVAIACVYITNVKSNIKKVFITIFAIAISTLTAYLATIWLAGGYAIYSEATERVMGAAVASMSVFAGAPVKAHVSMLLKFFVWLTLISLPTLIALGYITLKRKENLFKNPESKKLLIVLVCWMLPPIGLYSLIYFLKPTYLMILLVPISLSLASILFYCFKGKRHIYSWGLVSLIALSQLLFFFEFTSNSPKPLYRISFSYFKQQDASMKQLKTIVQRNNNSNTLLVWASHPALSIYATRVLSWKGKVAVIETNFKKGLLPSESNFLPVQTLEPVTMTWGKGVDLSKIKKVLVVETKKNQPQFNVYNTRDFLTTRLATLQ
jgi:hypothetical protein